MTNIQFCYWLQGYFEISNKPKLNVSQMKSIENNLAIINEPLWVEVKWIKDVCLFLKELNYKKKSLSYFLPLIQQSLNACFYHFIDNNKDLDYTLEELKKLHAGYLNEK